jgi:hypothetical protein
MKRSVFLAAVAMFAVACGATGSGANPSPTPRSGLGFDVSVSENEHAVTMHPGQKLEVALHAANGMNAWSHPVSSDPSTLEPTVDPAATAAVGVTLAAFVAHKSGTAQVTANASPKCPPNAACPAYLVVYSLTVAIT